VYRGTGAMWSRISCSGATKNAATPSAPDLQARRGDFHRAVEWIGVAKKYKYISPMSLIKSKKRIADHGEVFTPPWLVEAMLNLVKDETERIDSRFLEPACGSGNFLVRVLERKLAAVELKFGKSDFEKRHYALLALMCTYGVELLADNIAECRANMLDTFAGYLFPDESDDLHQAASYVLSQNLVHGDALTIFQSI
jgi:N-6 DNA Methylase